MTDKEIIKRAVEKATDNGMPTSIIDKGTFYRTYTMIRGRGTIKAQPIEFVPEDCYGLIFSHDFAKAFWGEERVYYKRGGGVLEYHEPAWTYHLKRMVIQKNSIKYLEQFLSGKSENHDTQKKTSVTC